MLVTPLLATLLMQAPASDAPRDSLTAVAGVVRTSSGAPVPRANVFVESTLEGTTTREGGVFHLRTTAQGEIVLIVRAIGFAPHRATVHLPTSDTIVIRLDPVVLSLAEVRVEAGRHVAGSEQGASLTALEVSSIPGARGDIARAFQTLPGVQTVDEGTGMFVRGGDSPETKVFLNGAELVDPQRIETPLGSVATTVDPFLLDGIAFSTGVFSARYGNTLSAIAELRTAGRPQARRSTLHASLANLSGRTAFPLGADAGVHATANVSDSRYAIALNGSPRRYDRAPHSRTASGSAVWEYRQGAELKIFGIGRTNGLKVWADGNGFSAISEQDEENSALLLTWRDRFGALAIDAGASAQRLRRVERFGALDLVSERRSPQAHIALESRLGAALGLSGGLDFDFARASYDGRIPLSASDDAPGRPTRLLEESVDARRAGAFGEAELQAFDRLRVRAGIRTDDSDLTTRRTWDPRVSLMYLPGSSVVLVLAAGEFHQLPDALPVALGDTLIPSTQARQITAGITAGPEHRLLRVEVYERRFDDLVQLDRDRVVVDGGRGSARGGDFFFRASLPASAEARAVYSLLRAKRTDPLTGSLATAPFDVTHSGLLIVQQGWGERLTVGGAYRFATGRPYTPVTGASEAGDGRWTPEFGTPYSARLPGLRRLDLSVSFLHAIQGAGMLSAYLSVYNILDRDNVASYRYSPDFSRRIPVRSTVGRGVFFGCAWVL